MSKISFMPAVLIDSMFAHPGKLPDQIASDIENPRARRRADRRAERREAMAEKIRNLRLIENELANLTGRQEGDLIAFWTDDRHWKWSRATVAGLLHKTKNAVGVAKLRALDEHPCGANRGRCTGVLGCAHCRGEALWKEIVGRILAKLREHEVAHA